MKASDLADALSIYSGVCRKSAVTEEYRCLLLSPNSIRGCAPFGIVETKFDLPISEPVYVEGEKLIGLVKTLPDQEIELKATKSSLQWKCGSSKGQFSLRGTKPPSDIQLPTEITFEAPEGFGDNLLLAATSCDSPALVSLGLFGIVLEGSEEGIVAYSSNNRTISRALPGPGIDLDAHVTLSPDSVKLVALATRDSGTILSIGESLLGVETSNRKMLLRQVAPLKTNIGDVLGRFKETNKVVPLQSKPVSEFLRRVQILSDSKGALRVQVEVKDDQTFFRFSDSGFENEISYENEDVEEFEAIANLDARDFSSIVSKVDSIAFDYVDKGAMILLSEGGFRYILDTSE